MSQIVNRRRRPDGIDAAFSLYIAIVPIVLIALAGQSACVESGDLTWAAVNSAVRAKYPEVEHLTTSELAAWIQSDSTLAPILLDVREPDEYDEAPRR